MTEGTGPGRGRPWWRHIRLMTLRWSPGLHRYEYRGGHREGRTVAVIGRGPGQ
jgi:hypothetical protein